MRTEIKLGLIIGLIVIGGGIFYAVNQGRSSNQADTIPFDVPVGAVDEGGRIDLAADETGASGRGAPGDTTPARPADRPLTTPRRRSDDRLTGAEDTSPARGRQLPPIARAPGDMSPGTAGGGHPTGTPTSGPATGGPQVAATQPAPGATAPPRSSVVTPPRETVGAPGVARPARLRDAPRPKPTATQYTVQRGDSLYAIALEHYGDGKLWTKIRDANPDLDPNRLKIGQVITLPPPEEPEESERAPEGRAETPQAGRATYVVEEGDSLISIARHVLGDGSRWKEIYELNKDKIDDPDVVKVGTELKLPPIEKAEKKEP